MGGRFVLRARVLASLERPQQPRWQRSERHQAPAPEAHRQLDCGAASLALVSKARRRRPSLFSGGFEPGLVGSRGDAAGQSSAAPWVYGHLRDERRLVRGLGCEPNDCHAVSESVLHGACPVYSTRSMVAILLRSACSSLIIVPPFWF